MTGQPNLKALPPVVVVTVLDRYVPQCFTSGHSLTTREANKLASDVATRKPMDPKSKGKK